MSVIIDTLLGILGSVLAWVFGLMPHLAVPSFITGTAGAMGTITSGLSGTTGFLPWTVIGLALALSLAGVVLAFAIRGVRIVASFLTLGGGS